MLRLLQQGCSPQSRRCDVCVSSLTHSQEAIAQWTGMHPRSQYTRRQSWPGTSSSLTGSCIGRWSGPPRYAVIVPSLDVLFHHVCRHTCALLHRSNTHGCNTCYPSYTRFLNPNSAADSQVDVKLVAGGTVINQVNPMYTIMTRAVCSDVAGKARHPCRTSMRR